MSGKKPVILVVDDDPPIIILMRTLLREFGFEPVTATTGGAAVVAARDRVPDLVLLDKNMPGMGGEQVIQALRREAGLDQVPILILSGEALETDEIARLGATAAVLKPFDVTGLIEQIRSTLGVRP